MPAEIREARIKYGTTFSTGYVVPTDSSWNPGTAHLVAAWWDDSKLKHSGIRRKQLMTRHDGAEGFAVGQDRGDLPLSMYVGQASTSLTTAPFEATLLSLFFGGIANPLSARYLPAGGGTHTVTKVYVANHDIVAGNGVLINGEARRVASIGGTGATAYINLEMALSAAPADNDHVVIATTVYPVVTTLQYLDLLLMGVHAEDQIQALGCLGPVTLGGLSSEDIAQFTLDLMVPHWRDVPAANRCTTPLSYASTPENSNTGPSIGTGALYFGDAATTTRNVLCCSDLKVDPGLKFQLRESAGNPVGFARVRQTSKLSFKAYVADNYASDADFTAQTTKQALIQCGSTAGATFFITLPALKYSTKPTRDKIGDMRALSCELEGTEPTVAATPVDLYSSMIGLHWA